MTQPYEPPIDWKYLGPWGPGMCNMDGSISPELDELLRRGGVFAQHAARDFCGYVWFAGGRFHELVMVAHAPRQTLVADSLDELMAVVNERWGTR